MQTSALAIGAAAPLTNDYTANDFEDDLRALVGELQTLANEQVRRKRPIEERWIKDLQAYHGRYDTDVEQRLTDAKKSRAFVQVTRKKTNSWQGRIQELLFPTDDRNWGIQPTPVPRLTKDASMAAQAAEAAAQKATAAMPASPEEDPTGEAAAQAQAMAAEGDAHAQAASKLQGEIDEAKKRSDAMQEVMDDQLQECQYPSKARDAIQDACRIGTGILKGPIAGDHARGVWKQQLGDDGEPVVGQFAYERVPDPAPIYQRVEPWSYFPDMSASRPEEIEFEFQRHLWTKKDLRRLVKENGFNAAAVRLLIEGQRPGPMTGINLDYLIQLRAITGDSESITGRYVGWEYHGPLEAQQIAMVLRAQAISLPADQQMAAFDYANEIEATDDPLEERRVIIHFCDGQVLKIVPEYVLDSGESLYSVFPFEPGESSVFGVGVPNIMGDSQRAINGGWRMAMDNAGLSVGPQIVIDMDTIEPVNGAWEITPRKVWRKKRGQAAGASNPFEVHDIPSNIEQILMIVREAHGHADDETALPPISEGEVPDGPAQTATADRARQIGSNVTFRRVVKSYDDRITEPCIRRLYDWNMQFNPRADIKGDMSISARGSSVLLAREAQSQILMGIVTNWPNNPSLAPAMSTYKAMRKALMSSQIAPDDVMVSEDEYKANIKAAQEAAAQQQDPAIVAAQLGLERAKEDGQTRLQVAQIQHDTEMMKLAEMKNMQLEDLKAMLFGKKMDVDSKERIFAGEVGAQRMLAQQAEEHGEKPAGSGGYV